MAYQINIDVKENYLLAFVSGTFDEKGDKEVLVDVLLECIKNNRSKLLFDLRALKGNITIFQRYALATYFTKLSRQHPDTSKIQVAVVGNPPLIDPNRFGETVALNLGLNIKVTTDIDEALKWLQVEG